MVSENENNYKPNEKTLGFFIMPGSRPRSNDHCQPGTFYFRRA